MQNSVKARIKLITFLYEFSGGFSPLGTGLHSPATINFWSSKCKPKSPSEEIPPIGIPSNGEQYSLPNLLFNQSQEVKRMSLESLMA